ncbi:hypothetical protein AGDE_09759 [Angomonas deanei]|nr:hypothetical protein AGDE_11288 [Angomonas deanei]EPY29852.1 hypothetical protein AGDE_09759 [Angomonas deanei]|eukprot:EPY26473.1 hypothetical protein AGDE_11288 [Angomonas deanei]
MTTSDKQTFVVVVADILTEPSMQPLSLLTVNAVGEFQIVLLYNISPTVFRIGQCLTFSSPEGTAEVCHAIPPLPLIDNASLELTIRHYYVNPELLKVNGNGLHRSAYVGLQMSSRLFA